MLRDEKNGVMYDILVPSTGLLAKKATLTVFDCFGTNIRRFGPLL